MSMDLGILSVSEMVSGGYDHERWEAKPLQYYIKYCERVWSCERIVNACFGRSLRALQLRVAARVSHPTTAPMLHRVHYRKGGCVAMVCRLLWDTAQRHSVGVLWWCVRPHGCGRHYHLADELCL